METFKVGEVAILCNLKPEFAKYNGEEVLINSDLQVLDNGIIGYLIYPIDEFFSADSRCLKKKRPPASEWAKQAVDKLINDCKVTV